MANTIAAVTGKSITHAILIDLELGDDSYYISSAYQPITFAGNTYTELGALLRVSEFRDDLKSSDGDITVSLSGVPSEEPYMDIVLSTQIRGGKIRIRRAFFDSETLELLEDENENLQVFDRYQGVITNFSVDETENYILGQLTNTISIRCASIQTLLENRITGQRTNTTDRQRYYPGSIDMDRVKVIQNTQFDFGKAYNPGPGYGGGGGGRDSIEPEPDLFQP
jgi:hypothetical protein